MEVFKVEWTKRDAVVQLLDGYSSRFIGQIEESFDCWSRSLFDGL